ncbi:hypothetical protein MKI84_13100 [Ancylobacter sp. A5.8]|uniref:hypothetical protein n=1 Tax=Ancylobacter gelatini TaxID=2919920 RepID=UPI001F4D8912|nr:hypothetical protein [Ancylobacter gelatini]MCJ8143855.1 hypothetical protein [Ancylobacter gelatini]
MTNPTVPAGFEIGLGPDGALGTLYLQELTLDLGNRRLTINARDQAAISGSADGVSTPISVALELEQPDPADDGRRRHIQEASITASCTLVLHDSGLPGIFVIKPPGG